MDEKPGRLVKLILGEVALLFILVILVIYLGQFIRIEQFEEIVAVLLPPAITIIFVLIATTLFLLVLQPIFKKALSRFLSPHEAQYTWQLVKYAIWIAALLILTFLLVGDIISISILLGLLVLLFILIFHKALMNFAGWLYIIFHHHIRIGDIVEVQEIKGRVVGITMMNTILVETSEFLGENRNTDRKVTLPNSFVFSDPVFSVSPSQSLCWDEIRLLLPSKSDHLLAKDIVTQVGNSIAGPIMRKYRQEMMKKGSSKGEVPPMPSTVISLEPEGVLVVLTYFCPTSERSELRSAISENILSEFNKEDIEVAFRETRT